MSNNTPRRSSRVANKQNNNPYQLAARSVLKKPETPKRTWNQTALSSGSGSNNNTTTTSTETVIAKKSIISSPANNLVMQQYGIINTLPVEPTTPHNLDASSSSSTTETTNNASVQ